MPEKIGWRELGETSAEAEFLYQDDSEPRRRYLEAYATCAWRVYGLTSADEETCHAHFAEGYWSSARRRGGTGAAVEAWARNPAVQTTVESLRRCRDIVALSAAFEGRGEALLLAGSMSYGRFFSVRQQRAGLRPSDLDIIAVVRDRSDFSGVLSQLADIAFLETADDPSMTRLEDAVKLAGDGRTVDLMVVTSRTPQGDPISADWGCSGGYDVSVHLCAIADLRHLLLPFGSDAQNLAVTIRSTSADARGPGKLRDERWISFSGASLAREVQKTRVGELEADLREPFRSRGGSMHLGRFVRSLLPRIEILQASPTVTSILCECAAQMNAILARDAQAYDLSSPLETFHPHRQDFSPHVRNDCREAPSFGPTLSEVLARRPSGATRVTVTHCRLTASGATERRQSQQVATGKGDPSV
ncbi:hypothetical protein AB0E08_47665 [Streptomyces sp. NPDC048281]|uniref:hypothetical protein n=1 Tax=Streptomyces sp. NPDC048281 TaxID=3154715 RepID=UPI003420A9B5